ncbi:hypothetical protein FACS1894200_05620 [Spirochaetia bacterium]|nr:hypothetical protein FACS1894200_05620 [Spirochaetia bacterium]
MANKKIELAMAALALVFGMVLLGCQTPVIPVTYTEPALRDMSGFKRIGVDSDNVQAVNYISEQLRMGKYTVATAAELQEWKQWRAEQEELRKLDIYQKGAIEISPSDLVKAYTDNVVRADSSYGAKALKISGAVAEIGQAGGGNYFVRLGVGNDSVDVYFRPSEVQKMASINKGQEVTIFGDCNGFKRPDMADTAEILRILGAGQHINIIDATFLVSFTEYPGNIDAVITLNIISSVREYSSTSKYAVTNSNGETMTDANGNPVYRDVTTYNRTVIVTIDYNAVRARNSSSIWTGSQLRDSSTSSWEDSSRLASVDSLVEQAIYAPLRKIASEMVPTQRTINVTLAKSDTKEAKDAMSDALKLVEAKNYAGAAEAYGKIYAEYNDFAAGYNQAVLTEASQGTEKAVSLMEALAKSTNNPTAQNMLRDMQRRNAANQQAAQQLSQ